MSVTTSIYVSCPFILVYLSFPVKVSVWILDPKNLKNRFLWNIKLHRIQKAKLISERTFSRNGRASFYGNLYFHSSVLSLSYYFALVKWDTSHHWSITYKWLSVQQGKGFPCFYIFQVFSETFLQPIYLAAIKAVLRCFREVCESYYLFPNDL